MELGLPAALKNPQFQNTHTGDGPAVLWDELVINGNSQHLLWNPLTGDASPIEQQLGTNKGGWGASRVRAMLNGADALTDTGSSYALFASSTPPSATAAGYDAQSCLLAAFPAELKAAIGSRETRYFPGSAGAGQVMAAYDKLWLPSTTEIGENTDNVNYSTEGTPYPVFSARTDALYLASSSGSFQPAWTRSSSDANPVTVLCFGRGSNVAAMHSGITPCFSLSR